MTARTVKTAISLDRELFDEANALARRLNTSRSQLVARALEELLARQRGRDLTAQLDAALADETEEEREEQRRWLEAARRTFRRVVANDPW